MHSNHHKARHRVPRIKRDVTPSTLFESLRQSQLAEDRQRKAEHAALKRPSRANLYGQVSCDLDRIAQANSSEQVLDILNDVVQLLKRYGWEDAIPGALRMERFQSLSEVHQALSSIAEGISAPGGGEGSTRSDAGVVLRTMLLAALNKLQQIGVR